MQPISLEKAIKDSLLVNQKSKPQLQKTPDAKSVEISKSKSSHVFELSKSKTTTIRSERKVFPTQRLADISLPKVDENTPSSRLRALLKALRQEVWVKQTRLDDQMHEEYHHLYETTHLDQLRMESFREAVFRSYSLRDSRERSPEDQTIG